MFSKDLDENFSSQLCLWWRYSMKFLEIIFAVFLICTNTFCNDDFNIPAQCVLQTVSIIPHNSSIMLNGYNHEKCVNMTAMKWLILAYFQIPSLSLFSIVKICQAWIKVQVLWKYMKNQLNMMWRHLFIGRCGYKLKWPLNGGVGVQ